MNEQSFSVRDVFYLIKQKANHLYNKMIGSAVKADSI